MNRFLVWLVMFFATVACGSNAAKPTDASMDETLQKETVKIEVKPEIPKGAYIITDSTKRELGTKELGRLRASEVVESSVVLVNGTSKPIVVLDAKGSCGCVGLLPDLKPFAPNSTSTIKFSYNAKGKNGKQFDVITIITSVGEFIVELKADVAK